MDDPTADASCRIARLDEWQRRLEQLWEGNPSDAMDAALSLSFGLVKSLAT